MGRLCHWTLQDIYYIRPLYQTWDIHRNKHRDTTEETKKRTKTPEKELNKMETSNLLNADFKTLVIMKLQELTGYFNSIKKTQAEMKATLS